MNVTTILDHFIGIKKLVKNMWWTQFKLFKKFSTSQQPILSSETVSSIFEWQETKTSFWYFKKTFDKKMFVFLPLLVFFWFEKNVNKQNNWEKNCICQHFCCLNKHLTFVKI